MDTDFVLKKSLFARFQPGNNFLAFLFGQDSDPQFFQDFGNVVPKAGQFLEGLFPPELSQIYLNGNALPSWQRS